MPLTNKTGGNAYPIDEDFRMAFNRIVRSKEYLTEENVFSLALISRVDYRSLSNVLRYAQDEYKEMQRDNGWQYRYLSLKQIKKVLRRLGYDIRLVVVARID